MIVQLYGNVSVVRRHHVAVVNSLTNVADLFLISSSFIIEQAPPFLHSLHFYAYDFDYVCERRMFGYSSSYTFPALRIFRCSRALLVSRFLQIFQDFSPRRSRPGN